MIRTSLLALALALAAGQASADDLSDLVDRYVAWRGGAAFERADTVRVKGEIETVGLKGAFERASDSSRSRQSVDVGVFRSTSAFDANAGWTTNVSGQIEDASATAVEQARRARLLAFDDALRGQGGATVALLGTETRDGKSWSVVRVSFGDSDTYDHFIDPATGALHGVRVVQDRRESFVRYAEWRTVDGVRVPFFEDTDSEFDGMDSKARVTEVKIGTPLDAALFARPADPRIYAFAAGKRSTGLLDFEFFNGNRIYIPSRVEGTETQVLLDSGAEATVLDKKFAEKLGLKLEGDIAAVGTGGQQQASFASGVDIQIGDMTLKNLTVAVIDLSAIEAQLNHPLPVILGKEVFNQLVVDLDFVARKIGFHEPAGFVPPLGATAVPVKEEGGLRAVQVSIEGDAPAWSDFDLGNGSPLIVYPAYWEPRKLLDGRPSSKTLAGAVGGLKQQNVTTLRTLSFGGATFRDVPAILTEAGASAVDSDRTLGNLGLPILSRFRLIADYPQDRLYLVPLADQVPLPFRKERSGMVTRAAGDRFVIQNVWPGSPAEAAGLKPGDEIVSVDGKPAVVAFSAAEFAALRNSQAGRTVELGLADGARKRITLRDYF